jgi:hypothetical protein
MSTAAWPPTIAAAVSSAVIAGAAPVTSVAAVSSTTMVASSAPSSVSSVAGLCDGERSYDMGQDGVIDIKMDNHRAAHGNH